MAAPELLAPAEPATASRPVAGADVVPAPTSGLVTAPGTGPRASTHKAARALIVHWVGVVLISLAVLAVAALILVPRATGSQTYSVLTNSMAPKLAPGTFLVMGPASFDDLKSGDVVTYQLASGRPEVITHRIVGFSATQQGERTLITKGDNNSAADPAAVREVQVRGKLLYAVPFAGYLANALGNTDRTLWVSIGAVALIGYGVANVARAVRRRLANRRQDDNQEAIAGENG